MAGISRGSPCLQERGAGAAPEQRQLLQGVPVRLRPLLARLPAHLGLHSAQCFSGSAAMLPMSSHPMQIRTAAHVTMQHAAPGAGDSIGEQHYVDAP